jgi:hypothetical protein
VVEDYGRLSLSTDLRPCSTLVQRAVSISDLELGPSSVADSDDLSDDDNESNSRGVCQSCESRGFEAKVLRALSYDVDQAASLMPLLHAISHESRSFSENMWQNLNINRCTSGANEHDVGSGNTNGISAGSSSGGSRNGKNKPNGTKDSQQDRDQDEQNHERHPKRKRGSGGENDENKVRLACPFHKWNPDKYNSSPKKYRTCVGPGFLEFRLLK